MESGRVAKSVKNACYGIITQILTVALNFYSRVRFVSILGIAANGLNGLFTEIIAMLSLAELGVGNAITYSLYKPLAENDRDRINRIMWLFRTAYLIIAAVILVVGICFIPFIHLIVKETEFEISYIRRIFFLFILRTVSTYLMSYKTSLLTADQRSYVVSGVNAASKILCTSVSLIVITLFKSFEFYLITMILFNLLTNFFITVYAKKHYAYINLKDKLSREECREILSNIKHIFVSKLSGRITNSTDNILISVIVNTIATGIYSNYSLIITNVRQLFEHIMASITGSFGNLMATDSDEHCERITRNLIFIFYLFGVVLGGGFVCVSSEFISIFFGEQFLLDEFTLYVSSVNLFICIWILPLWHIMSVSGLFKYDKRISITGSAVNLVVSLLLGIKLGMVGIFIGTTCTYIIQMLMKIYLLYNKRYAMSCKKYMIRTIVMFSVSVITIFFEKQLCNFIVIDELWLSFFVRGITSAGMSAAVIFAFYGRSSEFRYFLGLLKKQLKRKGVRV